MENDTLKLDLPYKVKMVKKFINFSIILIHNNKKIDKLKNILSYLQEFKDNNGEIIILDIDNDVESIYFAKEFGCKIEDATNFYRIIDDEMSNIINEKFNYDNREEKNIIKNGDTYIDFSDIRNYAASLASNDMILMIDINTDSIINFNLSELRNYINDEYDKIDFNIINKKSMIYGFYNRNKFKWKNIIFEELQQIENDIKTIKCADEILKISGYKKYSKTGEIQNINYDYDYLIESLSINCFLDPSNEKLAQKFAIELFNRDFLNSSYHAFNRHLDLCSYEIDRMKSMVYIGDYFIKTGNDAIGIEYYHKAMMECCLRRLPSYKLGLYHFLKNEREKSIFYLEGCLAIQKTHDIDDDNDDEILMYKDGPYSMLYVNYWWINDIKKGKYYFDKAIENDKYNKLYIEEAIYHYEYISNDILGKLSFQELQFLYSESKKYKTILEILPESARSTHALIKGCDGIVTIILDKNRNQEFLEILDYPGNLKIINVENISEYLTYNQEHYDMILTNNFDYLLNLDNCAKKIICGTNYDIHKDKIDNEFEISGVKENIWYKYNSTFEKTIIYKKKLNNE